MRHDPWFEVISLLTREPYSFRFFRAMWLLERMEYDAKRKEYERKPVGEFAEPKDEVARIRANVTLEFPASEIQALDASGDRTEITVNFMGLVGPMGVLPHHYTTLIEERRRVQDHALGDFLDIFNHRYVSLFYRAWLKYRFPVRYGSEGRDKFAGYLMSMIGLGTRQLDRRQSVDDESLIYYTGLLAPIPRSAEALGRVLGDYFRVPVEVVQFVGAWHALDLDYQCDFDEEETPSICLGMGAVVGDAIWDHQSRVRLRLGPLSRKQYEEFLPGRKGHRRLRDLTRFFSGDQFDYEAQLILRRDDVPGCPLGDGSVQLGWTTWIKTKPVFPRHAEDTVLLFE
ncbi:MAG: type VI secretion system baseplate subunit TssG [Bryobacteraceae bacterium]